MTDYVGIPYKYKGRSREGVDCWGLVCLYYKDTHNVELPQYFYEEGAEQQASAVNDSLCDWKEADDGDVILLRQFKYPSHVGIVQDKHFIHCEEGTGVVRVPLTDVKWKNRIIGRYRYSPQCNIVVSPSPLMTRRICTKELPGKTIQDIVDKYIEPCRREYAHVTVQGEPVPMELWKDAILHEGALVNITVVPAGGGKSILRIILSIAVTIWAGGAGGRLFSSIFSASAATGTAVAGIVGLLVVNALVPPPRISIPDLSGTGQSNVYSISGVQNRFNPFGYIPTVLGTHRMVPPYIGQYTMLEGSDQYLCALFCLGYGPLTVTDIKIGNTALASFDDVEHEIREGTPSDTPITIYPETASEDQLNVELTYAGGWQERTTEPDTDEIGVDITFPQGLVRYTDAGGTTWRGVVVEANYRTSGSADPWSNPLGYCIISVDVLVPATGATSFNLVVSGGGGSGLAGYVRMAGFPSRPYSVVITSYGNGYTSAPTVTLPGSATTFTVNLTAGHAFRETSTDPVRKGFRWPSGSRGTWDVRTKRSSADATTTKDVDSTYWTAIRSFKNEAPISADLRYNVALLAVRVKATGQLNGVISNLSCLVSSRVTSWSGSAWVADTASSNPADIYRHLFQGAFNLKAVADSRLDLTQLAAWSAFCTTKGFKFEGILDSSAPLSERLQVVAAAGRASFAMSDENTFSVVIEDTKSVPGDRVQMFGPKNIKSFSASRSFVEIPHAIRVKFFNRDNDYLQEIVTVYNDGYNKDGSGGKIAATIFQEMEFFGVTDSDHVWKLARFHLAQAVYRQEVFKIEVDYEHLVCRRGDLVGLMHDAPLLGVSDGRVKSVAGAVITVDENCPMESGKTYEVTVRLSDGSFETLPVTLSIGDNTTLTASSGSFTCAAKDAFHFGETSLSNIDCLVSKIEQGGDLTASLTLVAYNAGIYTADSGTIPTYTSQATLPADLIFPTAPTNLIANEFLYKESEQLLQGVSLLWYQAENTMVDHYVVQMLRPDGTAGWENVGSATNPTFVIRNLPAGDYSFRVKSVVGIKGSEWLTLTDETLDAYDFVPDDISNIRLVYRGTTPWIVWPEVTDIRPLKYEVRILKNEVASWEAGIPVGTTLNAEWSPQVKGWYYVKAIYADVESAGFVQAYVPFQALGVDNVKKAKTENPDWGGILSGSVFPNPPLVGNFDNEWNNYINGFDGSYDVTYDGSVLPTATGWTLGGTDYGSVSGGILTIGPGGQSYYYRTIGSLTGNQFLTVKAKLNLGDGAEANIQVFSNGNGTSASITFTNDGIVIGDTDPLTIECDMVSSLRTIKIELRESMKVFVDGELLAIIDGTSAATASSIYFGRFSVAATTASQYWSEIDYAVDTMTLDNTPGGWTLFGSTSISTAWSAQSDYGCWTINGSAGYKRTPSMTANDVIMLSNTFFDFTNSSVVDIYQSINNTASGYGIKIRYRNGTFYAESADGLTAIDSASFAGGLQEMICTIILSGDKFWFLVNRQLLLSGTAEADWAGLGDDIRFAGLTTSSVFVAGIEGAYLYHGTSFPNGLCVMPGDTGAYTIAVADQVDLGYAAESVVDSEMQASTLAEYDLLLVDDLLLEPDLLSGSSQNIQALYAIAEISLDSDDWTALVPGSHYAEEYNLRVSLTAPDDERLYLTGWEWEIDMPDRNDIQQVTSLATGALAVTYTKDFQAVPEIQATIMNEQAGDHVEITSETVSGFTLNVYNSAARVARTVNISAQGY